MTKLYQHPSSEETPAGGRWEIESPLTTLSANLPSELWLAIFEHATFTAVGFSTEPPDPFLLPEAQRPSTEDAVSVLCTALVMKRTLVRVCKAWYALAMPLLYRAIFVGKLHVVPALKATLAASSAAAERTAWKGKGKAVPLGMYTRRLDFSVRSEFDVSSEGRDRSHFALLASIVAYLPHLQIFMARYAYWLDQSWGKNVSVAVASALQRTSAASLRVLEWSNDVQHRRQDVWYELAAACPNLRILRSPPRRATTWFGGELSSVRISPQAFRQIRSISWSEKPDFSEMSQSTVPDANDAPVELLFSYTGKANVSDAVRRSTMLNVYGPRIHRLVFSASDVTGSLENVVLRTLLPRCPKLVQLVLVLECENWRMLGGRGRAAEIRLPSSMTHLGLQFIHFPTRESLFWHLMDDLLAIQMPGLSVLRIMDSRSLQELTSLYTSTFARLKKTMNERGVLVEDPDGFILM